MKWCRLGWWFVVFALIGVLVTLVQLYGSPNTPAFKEVVQYGITNSIGTSKWGASWTERWPDYLFPSKGYCSSGHIDSSAQADLVSCQRSCEANFKCLFYCYGTSTSQLGCFIYSECPGLLRIKRGDDMSSYSCYQKPQDVVDLGQWPQHLAPSNGFCSTGFLSGAENPTMPACQNACALHAQCNFFCFGTGSIEWDCFLYKTCPALLLKKDDLDMTAYACYAKPDNLRQVVKRMTVNDPWSRHPAPGNGFCSSGYLDGAERPTKSACQKSCTKHSQCNFYCYASVTTGWRCFIYSECPSLLQSREGIDMSAFICYQKPSGGISILAPQQRSPAVAVKTADIDDAPSTSISPATSTSLFAPASPTVASIGGDATPVASSANGGDTRREISSHGFDVFAAHTPADLAPLDAPVSRTALMAGVPKVLPRSNAFALRFELLYVANNDDFLHEAFEQGSPGLLVENSDRLPLVDLSFDVVIAGSSWCQRACKDTVALGELLRVLRPLGKLVLWLHDATPLQNGHSLLQSTAFHNIFVRTSSHSDALPVCEHCFGGSLVASSNAVRCQAYIAPEHVPIDVSARRKKLLGAAGGRTQALSLARIQHAHFENAKFVHANRKKKTWLEEYEECCGDTLLKNYFGQPSSDVHRDTWSAPEKKEWLPEYSDWIRTGKVKRLLDAGAGACTLDAILRAERLTDFLEMYVGFGAYDCSMARVCAERGSIIIDHDWKNALPFCDKCDFDMIFQAEGMHHISAGCDSGNCVATRTWNVLHNFDQVLACGGRLVLQDLREKETKILADHHHWDELTIRWAKRKFYEIPVAAEKRADQYRIVIVKTCGAKSSKRKEGKVPAETEQQLRSTKCFTKGSSCGLRCSSKFRRQTENRFTQFAPRALDFYYWRQAFTANKGHSRAMLAGSGPSVNAIDARAARIIKSNFDVWATNQFYFHHFLVPDFLHAEFLPDTAKMWEENFMQNKTKREQYRYTTFWGRNNNYPEILINSAPKHAQAQVFIYDDLTNDRGSCADKDKGAFRPKCGLLTKYCWASMSVVLTLMISMGYAEIYFIGIDLVVPHHFWSDNSAYRNLRLSDGANKRDKKVVHGTARRNFTEFVDRLFETNKDRVRAINLSPISEKVMPMQFVPLASVLRCYENSVRTRKAVYTVITGGYDKPVPYPPENRETDTDRILFTDDARLKAPGWEVRTVKLPPGGDLQLLSRDVKLRPHVYLAGYDQSLYIDANVIVVTPLTKFFQKAKSGSGCSSNPSSGPDLVVFTYDRNLTAEAAYIEKVVVKRKWLSAEAAHAAVKAQATRYKTKFPCLDDKYPGQFYGKVILRAHNERTDAFGELWYKEFREGVRRDQLSFRFSALETGISVSTLDTRSTLRPSENKRFTKWFRLTQGHG